MKNKQHTAGFLVFLILFMSPIIGIAIDIYTPSLPAISSYFHVTHLPVKLSLISYMLGFGVGQPFMGILADRIGRRRLILLALLVYIASSILATVGHWIALLIVMRFIQGCASTAIAAGLKAVMVDSSEGVALAKLVNYYSLGWSITPIVAPVIGGYFQHYIGWQASFYFVAIYAAVCFVICSLFLSETLKAPIKQDFTTWLSNCKTILTDKPYFLGATFLILEYGTLSIFYITSPFIMQDVLGVTAVDYGHFMLLIGLGYFIGISLNRVLLQRFFPVRLVGVGLVGTLVVTLLSLLATVVLPLTSWLIIIVMIVIFFLDGFIFSNVMSKCMQQFPAMSGTASALLGGILSLGGALISIIAGGFHFISFLPIILIFVAFFLVAVILYFRLYLPAVKHETH